MRAIVFLPASVFSVSLFTLGCGPDVGVVDPLSQAHGHGASLASSRLSEWSAPVNLGTVVNSPAIENSPEVSKDGLSLYFGSNRTGGIGSIDLYVSQRACANMDNPLCAWGTPVNLGSDINTISIDGGPTLSRDGYRLFLISDRAGGFGSNDIWVSSRTDLENDFAWAAPVNLGPTINTEQLEAGPNPWGAEFYFHHGPGVGNTDIYVSRMRGDVFGEPVLVEELSSPNFFDQRPSIRFDGREIILSSDRPGGLGLQDIWVSTRQNNGALWATPINIGAPINTEFQEQTPMISEDGTLLLFTSNRPSTPTEVCGLPPLAPCDFDLYVASRSVQPEE